MKQLGPPLLTRGSGLRVFNIWLGLPTQDYIATFVVYFLSHTYFLSIMTQYLIILVLNDRNHPDPSLAM